jgi:hypothetical protein
VRRLADAFAELRHDMENAAEKHSNRAIIMYWILEAI